MQKLWVRKPIALLMAEAEERSVQAFTTHDGVPFERTLSAFDLVALGIGAIIYRLYGVGHSRIARPVPTAHPMPRIKT